MNSIVDGFSKTDLKTPCTNALLRLSVVLIGLTMSLPVWAYKSTDVIPTKNYPIQEIGVVAGFEWLDGSRLVAIKDRELAVYDLANSHWTEILPVDAFVSSSLACLSIDSRAVQVNVRTTAVAAISERRRVRLNPDKGVAVSTLEEVQPQEAICGSGMVWAGGVATSNWYGEIPGDRAIYPLARRKDGYFDFGIRPLSSGYNYGKLKEGYLIDASGWPAPGSGSVFGLFHVSNGQAYLIEGTANQYLVDATRVSPDGCKVAYQVAGQSYPFRRAPDTRIVNLCSQLQQRHARTNSSREF